MQILNHNYFRIIVLFLCLILSGCRSTYSTEAFSQQSRPFAPDFEIEKNWAVLPTKYPQVLNEMLKGVIDSLDADVFYVYPTLITHKKDKRWNAPVNDIEQNNKVLNTAVLFQASAWASSGKLYVPYYRQAHIRSYSMLDKGGKEALMLAYADVRAAFKIYLKKFNKGRPIIIAGHSQGATHCIMLLKEFFDEKDLQTQLVAAYIPGIGIKENEFKNLKPMTKPDQIGGYVSWNTFKRNKLPKKYDQWYKGSVTSNPINWDASRLSIRKDHLGFLYTNKKIYDKALKIELIDGMVWTSLPRFPLRVFALFKKNYHVGDVNLFWQDIRLNAEQRVKAWLKKQDAQPSLN